MRIRKMFLRLFGLLGAATAQDTADIGICYTRNNARDANRHTVKDNLRKVLVAAQSVRRHDASLPLCLFTDLDKDTVESYAGPLFRHILPDGFSTFMPRSEAERQLVSGDSLSRAKLRSRLGRILNLQRAPYALTLFLDDDTFACLPTNGATGVRGALRALQSRAGTKTYRHYDIRAHTFAKHRREKIALRDAHECAWALAKDGSRLGAGLEAHCYDALMQGASFCGGVQGGALAVTPGPRLSKFSEDWARAYVDYYASSKGDETSSSWGGDQAPLAQLMDAHCNAHPELALPSGPQNNTSADKWTVGALPYALNVRDASERPSDATLKCTVPLMGPMLVLHQKRYLKEYLGTRDRLDSVCATTNKGYAWLSANVTSAIEGKRCKWMGRPEVNATVSTMRPRRGPRRQAVRTSDREVALARIAAAEDLRERQIQEAHERRRRRKRGGPLVQREPAPRAASLSMRNRQKRKERLNMRRGAESVAYEAVALA